MLSVGGLQVDRLRRTVSRSGQPLYVSNRQFDLLTYLMQNANSVVTREMIAGMSGRGTATWTNVIDVQIAQLRRKSTARPVHGFAHGAGTGLSVRQPAVSADFFERSLVPVEFTRLCDIPFSRHVQHVHHVRMVHHGAPRPMEAEPPDEPHAHRLSKTFKKSRNRHQRHTGAMLPQHGAVRGFPNPPAPAKSC